MINWKKHPEAKTVTISYLDGKGMAIAGKSIDRPTQKTVADAVEAHHLGWDDIPNHYSGKVDGVELVLWNKVHGGFEQGCDGYNEDVYYKVCTHAEFEAYVKEQEGEKWTHVDGRGIKCRLLSDEPDYDGFVPTVKECGGYRVQLFSELKPIKPTMTKDDCELLLRFKKHIVNSDKCRLDDMLDDFIDQHDII